MAWVRLIELSRLRKVPLRFDMARYGAFGTTAVLAFPVLRISSRRLVCT